MFEPYHNHIQRVHRCFGREFDPWPCMCSMYLCFSSYFGPLELNCTPLILLGCLLTPNDLLPLFQDFRKIFLLYFGCSLDAILPSLWDSHFLFFQHEHRCRFVRAHLVSYVAAPILVCKLHFHSEAHSILRSPVICSVRCHTTCFRFLSALVGISDSGNQIFTRVLLSDVVFFEHVSATCACT
jgi:hypothetical protein